MMTTSVPWVWVLDREKQQPCAVVRKEKKRIRALYPGGHHRLFRNGSLLDPFPLWPRPEAPRLPFVSSSLLVRKLPIDLQPKLSLWDVPTTAYAPKHASTQGFHAFLAVLVHWCAARPARIADICRQQPYGTQWDENTALLRQCIHLFSGEDEKRWLEEWDAATRLVPQLHTHGSVSVRVQDRVTTYRCPPSLYLDDLARHLGRHDTDVLIIERADNHWILDMDSRARIRPTCPNYLCVSDVQHDRLDRIVCTVRGVWTNSS